MSTSRHERTPLGKRRTGRARRAPRAERSFSDVMFLRPSRYCPTDHLLGFAQAVRRYRRRGSAGRDDRCVDTPASNTSRVRARCTIRPRTHCSPGRGRAVIRAHYRGAGCRSVRCRALPARSMRRDSRRWTSMRSSRHCSTDAGICTIRPGLLLVRRWCGSRPVVTARRGVRGSGRGTARLVELASLRRLTARCRTTARSQPVWLA